MTETRDDSIEVLADSLWQLWRVWSERSNTPEKLSAEQYWVLRALEREAPLTVSELARRRGITTAAMTIATQRLQSAGWVRRTRDRRRVLIDLTGAGHGLWLRVSTERQQVLRALLRHISPEEQAVLSKVAMKMRGFLTQDGDKRGPAEGP